MKKNLLRVTIAGLILALLSGCASTKGLSMSKVQKELKNGVWASPKDSVLFFTECLDYNDFLQQNPEVGYKFYKLNGRLEEFMGIKSGSVGFIEPIPAGSELKIFSKTYKEDYKNTIVTEFYGISGVDVVLDKPGLFFYGKDNKKHSSELKCLKLLLKYFKNSEWEQVIQDRIEEIKNENK